jgi:hypothetical protein
MLEGGWRWMFGGCQGDEMSLGLAHYESLLSFRG